MASVSVAPSLQSRIREASAMPRTYASVRDELIERDGSLTWDAISAAYSALVDAGGLIACGTARGETLFRAARTPAEVARVEQKIRDYFARRTPRDRGAPGIVVTWGRGLVTNVTVDGAQLGHADWNRLRALRLVDQVWVPGAWHGDGEAQKFIKGRWRSSPPASPPPAPAPSARTATSFAEIAKLLRATRPQTQAQEEAERARKAIADWANVQAVIAAAQSRVPPGPQTAYVYNPTEKTAVLVPIVARAGVLFVRRDQRSTYTFTHEPTGLSVSAPRSEVVTTKKRALALLEFSARPVVLAALRVALASGARPAMVERFNKAWAAEAQRPSFGDLAMLLHARQAGAA